MGFDCKVVALIMCCVMKVRYTLVHDNREMGPIIPSRGIRQGDPLSPYLFILCAEGLSALIRTYEERQWLHGICVCRRAPSVTHILFADDSYVFCKSTEVEAEKLMNLLAIFERASGQRVNVDKSSVFFSTNTSVEMRADICRRMVIAEADGQSTYLGLPNTIGRNKSVILGFLKERIRNRLQGWDSRLLSRAGKEVLIKTVAQSLPSYAMSVFLLPLEVSRDLEMQMSKFWWRSSSTQRSGIHWMNWNRLCFHKNQGGMGFRDLRDFNISLLGKQGWRLMTRPNSLSASIFKARYFPSTSFLEAPLGNNPSFVWRSIWETQGIIRAGVRWRVGNGTSIPILATPWLPTDIEPCVVTYHPKLEGRMVSSLFLANSRQWDEDVIDAIFVERDRDLILSIPLSFEDVNDCLYWSREASGCYSVKSAYNLLQFLKGRWGSELESKFFKKLWKLQLPPKVKDLIWRACSRCLPTLVQLKHRHVPVSTVCPVCAEEDETIIHSLVQCRFAKQCLQQIGVGDQSLNFTSFASWLEAIGRRMGCEKLCEIAMLCWAVWRARNDVVWNNKSSHVIVVVSAASSYLEQWRKARKCDMSAVPLPSGLAGDGAEIWVKPNQNQVKVNVDVAIFAERMHIGWGMVARDHHGRLIDSLAMSKHGVTTPELAEIMGIREALSWIKQNQWGEVLLETDCLVAVNAIRSQFDMSSPFGSIVHDCRCLLRLLNKVSLLFIYRSANRVAHCLARVSYSFTGRRFNGRDVPVEVRSALLDDYSS